MGDCLAVGALGARAPAAALLGMEPDSDHVFDGELAIAREKFSTYRITSSPVVCCG